MSYHCFSDTKTVARKPHRCVWCSRLILSGSTYRREHSVYDGHHQNFAWHEACRKDADDWFSESGSEEFATDNEMPWLELYRLEVADLGKSP